MSNGIRRFAAALLAIPMMCAAGSSAAAQQPNGISVSSDTASRGDEFTITVTVPPTENADTASVKLTYDDATFEVLEWAPVVHGGVTNAENGLIALLAANVARDIDLSGGLEMTARLRVKEDAAGGEYRFVLKDHSFCYVDDSGYEFVEVWFPDATEAVLKVDAPAAETAAEAAETAEIAETSEMPTSETEKEAEATTLQTTESVQLTIAPETPAELQTAEETAPEEMPEAAETAVEKASGEDGTLVIIIIVIAAVVLTAALIVVMIIVRRKKVWKI